MFILFQNQDISGGKMNAIYEIKVIKWNEHNPGKKSTYKKTMISNNLISDAKVLSLPSSHRWLFLCLLLICGDHANDTVTLTEQQVNGMLAARVGAENALYRLQELQLVTFEKCATKKERKKEIQEGKERKNHKVVDSEPKKDSSEIEKNRKVWNAYFNAYRIRYGVDPVRNGRVNGQVKQLVARLGVDEAVSVVEFYLKHNDSFYLKNTHSIGLCLSQCESLRTQMLRGKPITQNEIRRFEKTTQQTDLIRQIEEEGI